MIPLTIEFSIRRGVTGRTQETMAQLSEVLLLEVEKRLNIRDGEGLKWVTSLEGGEGYIPSTLLIRAEKIDRNGKTLAVSGRNRIRIEDGEAYAITKNEAYVDFRRAAMEIATELNIAS